MAEPGLFSFFANAPDNSALSYPALEARRRMALALMSRNRKGYPKTLGEGLTAIGDSIGEMGVERRLAAQEAAYQKMATEAAGASVPGEAKSATPMSYAPADDNSDTPVNPITAPPDNTPVAAPAPTPVAPQEPGVSDGGYNMLDAQAGMKRAGPGYIQDAIQRATPDPDTQAYLSQLSAAEANGPGDVSKTGASGPFQFTRGTGKDYGLVGPGGDQRQDLDASTRAALALTQNNAANFERRIGRPPTMAELALMHQQGGTTGANMIAGTGNAPAGNLAVNNVPASAGPAQAVAQIKGYYGMGDRPVDPRAKVAAALAGQEAPQANPMQTSSQGGPLPLAEPQAGGPPADQMAFAGLPPEINQGSSIKRAPPLPQPQIAQAPPAAPPQAQMPQGVPPPGSPAQPVPPAPSVGRVDPSQQLVTPAPRIPLPQDVPMTDDEKRGYQIRARGLALGDPNLQKQGDTLIQYGAGQRKQQYDVIVKDYQDQMLARHQKQLADEAYARGQPARELELQKAEEERQQRHYQTAIERRLGGIPQEVFVSNLNKSKDSISGIPAATDSIKRARGLVDKMFTGSGADIDTSLAKVMAMSGFPLDPRASATEQFKTAMTNVMAQNRKAVVGAGAQSEAELALLQKSTAADAKLTEQTIRAALDAAESLNLKTALAHQKQVRRFAGEEDKDRQGMVYGTYGVPNMVDLVPQGAVNKLMRDVNDPKAHQEFDDAFQTPGLSQEVLRYRGRR